MDIDATQEITYLFFDSGSRYALPLTALKVFCVLPVRTVIVVILFRFSGDSKRLSLCFSCNHTSTLPTDDIASKGKGVGFGAFSLKLLTYFSNILVSHPTIQYLLSPFKFFHSDHGRMVPLLEGSLEKKASSIERIPKHLIERSSTKRLSPRVAAF